MFECGCVSVFKYGCVGVCFQVCVHVCVYVVCVCLCVRHVFECVQMRLSVHLRACH